MKNIKKLDSAFIGIGEVKNTLFNQVYSSEFAHIYKLTDENIRFEVFERKNSPICIDFANRVYSETEFKETYPKSKAFGVWAWTYKSIEEAVIKAKEIESKCKEALK